MQPMMENWASNKGEWIEGISWKGKNGTDQSTLGYHKMLFSREIKPPPPLLEDILLSNIYLHSANRLTFIVTNAYFYLYPRFPVFFLFHLPVQKSTDPR